MDLWSPDQKGTRTATNDAPCTTASAASRTTWTTSISNAASPSFRCKRTAASSPPNKGSRARARTKLRRSGRTLVVHSTFLTAGRTACGELVRREPGLAARYAITFARMPDRGREQIAQRQAAAMGAC